MNYRKKAMLMAGALLCLNLSIYSQSISLKMNNVSVKKAMTELQTKSGYSFVYIAGDVDTDRTVSVDASQLSEAVAQILKGQNVSYEIQGKNIVIKKGTQQVISSDKKKKVTGTVKGANGDPIIGATVVEKGTTNGTVTDFDGNYTLELSENGILAISYIGYESQEFASSQIKSGVLSVTLREDTEVMDEVVVVGFGTQKKVNLTGSVGLANAKEIESRPVVNATQALQGLVPGLQITSSTGELDKEMNINIRGAGTIGEGSSGAPLILIDGMEGDLNSVNPQDIESISVLKDAAAASIYGSRAPFGVILVTTKKGKQGKASINYNNSFRISSPVHLPEMMNSYVFANFMNSAALNANRDPIFKDNVMQDMLDYQAGLKTGGVYASENGQWGKPDYDPFTTGFANLDWYKELYKSNVFSQEHNVSVNGGSEKVTYYASFNYLGQNGLLRHGEDGLKRYNVTAKINANITKWLTFNYSTRFTRTDNYRPSEFGDDFYSKIGRLTWPNVPAFDPNGYYFTGGNKGPAIRLAEGGKRNAQTDRLYNQAALLLEPIKNWITHIEFNYSIVNSDINQTTLPYYDHDVNGNIVNTNGTSSLYVENSKQNYLNLNIFSEYNHTWKDSHNLKVMVGFQAEDTKYAFSSVTKYGLIMEDFPELDLTSGTDGKGNKIDSEISGYHQEWSTAGFFGRVNYDYQGRYLAEVNMRYDGTSRFRAGNRWQLYPSFSLGWNIARESFWEPISDIVGTLKLRASYGELGNQNTNDWYPTYRILNLGAYNGEWLQNGSRPNTATIGDLVSHSLTWETIRTWNVGLDFGLLNNRLTGSFDYYTRYTDNMVGPAPQLPLILGIGTPNTNNCNLSTRGWELQVGWNDQLQNGLRYGVKFLLSDAKSKVDSYPGNTTHKVGNDTFLEGHELGEIWGFETVGIAKSDEEMQNHLDKVGGQDALGDKWSAGDIMYADLDGKPGITKGASTLEDHGDLKVIGNNTPRYLFGIDLFANWKNFDLRVFFQGVMKRDYWQGSSMFWGVNGNDEWHSQGLAEHADYFRATSIGLEGHEIAANLDAYYPRPIFGENKNNQVQTRYLQNASYIRLKNLQLGYTLPAKWMDRVGLGKCRIFISGENLWTGTGLSPLFDPETLDGGDGGNGYPLSRTWSFGLSLTL